MIIMAWVLAALLLCMFLAAHLFYWLDAKASRRDSSRFPMFAVRDDLIYLVASGQMHETDPAWKLLYLTANHFLDLSINSTIFEVIKAKAEVAMRAAQDPKIRERLKEIDEALASAAERTPQFGRVLQGMGGALRSLTRDRTPRWQWYTLTILVAIITPVVVLRTTARKLFFKPTTTFAAMIAQPFPFRLATA